MIKLLMKNPNGRIISTMCDSVITSADHGTDQAFDTWPTHAFE